MKLRNLKNKNIKWWIGIGSCLILFAVIGIFGYEKTCFIFHGVKIEAVMEKGSDSSLVVVKGVASKAILLTLNGREIFIDKNGSFSESVVILPGFSVVTLNALDKFGKVAEKKFEIVYEKDAGTIAFRNN